MDSDSIFSPPVTGNELSLLSVPDVLKRLREGMLIVGENLRVEYANNTATKIFSIKNESLRNKRLSEVVRNIAVFDAFQKSLSKGKTVQVGFETHTGVQRSFDVNVTPLGFGESKYAIGVFYDTTRIDHLEKVRQEFLSNISHELRTPLTSILAFVETLENGGIDDRENNRRFLDIIGRNAERMQLLIDDISELSSIEDGSIKLDLRPTSVFKLVNEVFASLSAKAEKRGVVLRNEVHVGSKVIADKFRLEQMLTNLIDNAIKFNAKEGAVTVRYAADQEFTSIDVCDTGEGIPEVQMPRVFERLYRVDRARSREIGGTGLGLAIVKHLARLHGGEVAATSTVGKGSTFTVRLPANP